MTVNQRDYKIVIWSMLFLSSIFLTIILVGVFYHPSVTYEFGVVMDISSYDIEFNLYKWKNDLRIKKTGRIEKKYTISCDVNVHAHIVNYDGLRDSLFSCMRKVISTIEDYELINSTIFVYGTERTRLMCNTDYIRCNNIFNIVSDLMNAFDIRLTRRQFRPLEGYEEAMFGWISVNDHFNHLFKTPRGDTRFSTIDVKNYSVLVAFEDPASSIQPSKIYNRTTITVYGNKFFVHEIDLMCYGLRPAYNKTVAKLVPIVSGWRALSIRHPCLHSKYSETIQFENLFGPCVINLLKKSAKMLKVQGDWNPEKCSDLIRESLQEFEITQDFSLQPILKTFNLSSKGFYAFSRLADLASLVNFKGSTLDEFYEVVKEVCGSEQGTPYEMFCFDSMYSYHLAEFLNIRPTLVKIGHLENLETVTGSMIYNSKDVPVRKCGCLITRFGLTYLSFSLMVFGGLALFILVRMYKLEQNKGIFK